MLYIHIRICTTYVRAYMLCLPIVKKLQPIKRDENVSLRPSTAPMKGGSGKKQSQQQQQQLQQPQRPPLDKAIQQDDSLVYMFM